MSAKRVILLVEDDPNDVLLAQRAFRKAGLAVELQVANNGEEAIHYLRGDGVFGNREINPIPELILLDIKMPKKTGFEVLEWLNSHGNFRRIPVVMVSSSKVQSDVNRAYDLGANAYLVKPVDFTELLRLFSTVSEFFTRYAARPDVK